jgi:hypothetical protein
MSYSRSLRQDSGDLRFVKQLKASGFSDKLYGEPE